MNSLSISSFTPHATPSAICTTDEAADALRGMMQSIALSHHQVVESSQAKDAAFLRRIEQLNDLIQQLASQEALLDRLMIAETAEMQTKSMTHNEEKVALEATITNLLSIQSTQVQCIATIDNEIAVLNDNLQQLANERARCPSSSDLTNLLVQNALVRFGKR